MDLMLVMGMLGLAAIVLAMLVERSRLRRYEKGDFRHMAHVSSLRDRAREDRRHPLANASKSVQSP